MYASMHQHHINMAPGPYTLCRCLGWLIKAIEFKPQAVFTLLAGYAVLPASAVNKILMDQRLYCIWIALVPVLNQVYALTNT